MQQLPLLQTKLHIPPTRAKLVSRARLIERLNAALLVQGAVLAVGRSGCKLTLVSAPAGFGKTTLLSEWLGKLRHGPARENQVSFRTAWLSLDENDDEPTRFLAYLIAALQTIEPHLGQEPLSALQSSRPPPVEAALTLLINEIAAIRDRVVFVLDDYHLIEAQPTHNALAFLVEHLPLQMHLVIATRVDPHLPLARLRALGQLTELRAADLRFTFPEAAEFLDRVMGLDLSSEDIAALEARTEGWITGLQLAAISMQGHEDVSSFIKSFTGGHRFVLDYLIEEVLQQQTEGVRAFLRQTAILDRLTGSLCDALTGQDNGQATLEMLERANLFVVSLDEERRWYRYHRLFADLLRRHQPLLEQVPVLHRRASDWYERNGFTDSAIDHAVRAEDFERAAHLIEEHFDLIYRRGEHTKLRRWLARLPVQLVFSNPQLCLLHAWGLFSTGHLGAAERSLKAAETALDINTGQPPAARLQMSDADRMMLRGRAATLRAFLASYRGDGLATVRYSRRALEHLPPQDLTWRSVAVIALGDGHTIEGDMAAAYQARLDALAASRQTGDDYLSLIANLKVAVALRQRGQMEQVIEICRDELQRADESGISETVVAGWLLALWGETLAELNDLDGAIDRAQRGVELAERGRDVAMLGWSYLCLMRILFSRGDVVGAKKTIEKVESIAREHDLPPWIANPVAAWQARIWLTEGRLTVASQWVQERALSVDRGSLLLHGMEYMVLARILIAQGRLDETATLLRRLLDTAEAEGDTATMIQILSLEALAAQAEGDTARAIARLERALALAEPSGFIRAFVDEGPPMARLLHEAAARGIAPDYTRRLLAAFPVPEPAQAGPSSTQAPVAELVEPLSKRELDVLGLVAQGLTNREIAAKLFLSLNTVKAHTRNIYGKLGVGNRMQAAARARALGILPPL